MAEENKEYYTDDGRKIIRFIRVKGKAIPIVENTDGTTSIGIGKEKQDDFVSSNQTPEQFNKAISEARESRPIDDKWRVDVHETADYEGCKLYKSDGGSTIAVKDGDIISVCKKIDDETTSGKELLARAVKMGGVKLDSFEGNHRFYTKCGFEPVSWTPFNEEYAPDGWKESGCKPENVIFYKYVGIGNVKNTDVSKFMAETKPFTGDSGYDDAYAYRDSQINNRRAKK